MTRSSTNELFTPYKEPEREFRSSRRHFKSLSLDELRSPDFNLFSDQEYSEEEEAEAMAETMEQYMSKTRTDYGSGVARPKIEEKDRGNFVLQWVGCLQTTDSWKSRDTVMSDSEDSTVTYTEAPPSPNFVPGLEELEQAPPLPEFIPEPVYPEFMPLEDDVLPAEEQPLPAAVSPIFNSPGYIPESDPEEDPKEDDNEDPEEDPADYPTDRDDDDDEEEPSRDEADDDEEDEDDEEEEEHIAPADSTAVAFPAVDHVPSAEETEPFETDKSAATPPPHPAFRVTARISIRAQTPVSLPSDTEVARLLAIPTPPPSPLSPWSSPLPQIPSPPLP
ncbi:hypothetical protein Tco_1439480 [Tanacetum coccineum]